MPNNTGRPSFDEWYKTVPSDRNDMSNYNLRRAYELAPFEQLEKWRTATPEQLNDENYHLMSAYEDPKTGVWEFMKSKNHPTLQGELDFYYGNSPESKEFRSKYDLDKSGEYYKYVPRTQQGVSVVPTGAPTDTNIVRKPVQTVMTPEQMQNAAVKTKNDLVKANIFAKTPAAQVYNPNPQSAEGVASDYRRVMQSIAQDPKGSVGSGVNTVKAAHSAPQITSMEDLAKAMGYTSPEEEERLRKASVTNQRIMAIGDALRHIGNIANTVRYAPSQQFNSPVTDEIARYERGKALRDRANAALLTYQQQKERQDALQRRWENELEYKRQKADEDRKAIEKYRDRVLKGKEAAQKYKETKGDKELEERIRHNKAQEETANRRVDISASKGSSRRSSGGGGGGRGKSASDLGFWDKDGNYHQYKTVTGLDAGLREYAPELQTTETYDRTDTTGKKVKGSRKKSVGRLAGEANARYNPKHKQRYSNTAKLFAKK